MWKNAYKIKNVKWITGMCTPKTTRNLHESLFQNYNLCMKSKLHRKRSTLTGLFLGGFDFKYNKVNYI